MALITGSNALNTVFTPAAGRFRIQISSGRARLQSRADGSSPWVSCHLVGVGADLGGLDVRVVNDVAGTQYRFTSDDSGVQVRADQ